MKDVAFATVGSLMVWSLISHVYLEGFLMEQKHKDKIDLKLSFKSPFHSLLVISGMPISYFIRY